jgi:hypothetical protein
MNDSINERPYPFGLAWDEAWRQRQRADKLESERNVIQPAYGYTQSMGKYSESFYFSTLEEMEEHRAKAEGEKE